MNPEHLQRIEQGPDVIKKMAKIVTECQAAKIKHGAGRALRIDMTTANIVVSVWLAMRPDNQVKFLDRPLPQVCALAFKLANLGA